MTDEGDKELSKEEETPSQWIPKLKKVFSKKKSCKRIC